MAEDNFIIDNAIGVFAEALRKSVFRRNVIAENDLALQIFSSCSQNLFVENNFVENLSPLRLIGKRSDTRWQEGGRGNYWSDFRGYDLIELAQIFFAALSLTLVGTAIAVMWSWRMR